jgi:hypothetical protein
LEKERLRRIVIAVEFPLTWRMVGPVWKKAIKSPEAALSSANRQENRSMHRLGGEMSGISAKEK